MELFPSRTIFLQIGPLTITWYAILSISGFIAAYYVTRNTLKKMKYDIKIFDDYFYYLLPIAYIGARIWYCIFEWKQYVHNPISVLYIWNGGLAWHGGVIAGFIFTIFFCKKHKWNLLRFGDAIMPNLLLGQAIGRWGNFINQEAYGPIVEKENLSFLPEFIQEGMYIHGNYHMPMFFYEFVGNMVGWILIKIVFTKYGYKKRGDLIYAYCMWSGMVRFYIESFRTDSLMIGPFKTAQLISILLIVIGLLGLLGVYNKLFKNVEPFKKVKPTILFDADGTLIDTVPLISASYKHVVEKVDPTRNMTDLDYKNIIGPPLKETFEMLFPNADSDTIQSYVDEYVTFNLAKHDEMVTVLPNVVKMLDYLKENGYDIGVVSNKREYLVRHGLRLCGIDQYFEVVICREQMTNPKPDPEGLMIGCQMLGRTYDDFIYCGDAAGDIIAAKRMGAYSLAYVPDSDRLAPVAKEKPSKIITDWLEFIDLLEEENEWNDISIL